MATTEQRRRGAHMPLPTVDRSTESSREPNARAELERRREIVGWSGLNVLAGIWLIISPFVLDYGGGDAVWNPIVFGAIVTVLAFARFAGAFEARVLASINMAIGVWLFISAWWLADTARASWNVGVMGIVVFFLAAFSLSATDDMLGRRRT